VDGLYKLAEDHIKRGGIKLIYAYSIFDKKVGAYYRPSFAKSVIEVQRSLEQLCKDKTSSLALYPSDFDLFKVGAFDEEEGTFVIQTKPEFIFNVAQLLAKEPQNGN